MFNRDILRTLKGMRVISPRSSFTWTYIESILTRSAEKYCYSEVRFPVLDRTKLFTMSIGRDTDIVTKEMFTFEDKGGESVTLRPEGTVCCIRSLKECGLLRNSKSLKLWYLGDMFRRERPQKGRYRQFKQFGVEFFCCKTHTEIELFIFVDSVFRELGVLNAISLHINTVGCVNDLKRYKKFLKYKVVANEVKSLCTKGFRQFFDKTTRNTTNLKLLPLFFEFLCTASVLKFAGIIKELCSIGIKFKVDLCLVRGLSYYDHTVYEWVQKLQSRTQTICAGGRYTMLVKKFSKDSCGFSAGVALGVDRLVELYTEVHGEVCRSVDAYTDLSTLCMGIIQLRVLNNFKKHNKELIFYFVFRSTSERRLIKNAQKENAGYVVNIDFFCYLNDCVQITKLCLTKSSLEFKRVQTSNVTTYIRLNKQYSSVC